MSKSKRHIKYLCYLCPKTVFKPANHYLTAFKLLYYTPSLVPTPHIPVSPYSFQPLIQNTLKGTVNVISSDPQCKEGNGRFPTIP